MKNSPTDLILYLVDPKQVELQQYKGIPHVKKVIDEVEYAPALFKSLVNEMESRYKQFSSSSVKNIEGYNKKREKKMPYIVTVVDEYADLIMQDDSIEHDIERLGQKARAAGIHLVIATQRPSADILSKRLQANIPNAISFNLGNNTNYRTVFGTGIPYNNLLGRGDGVARFEAWSKEFQRFQGCIISPDESEEEQVYEMVREMYQDNAVADGIEVVKEKEPIDKLKEIIANTGETRVGELQKQMEIRMNTVQELMTQLVEEGWLIKHKARSKGYELIATEDMIKEYLK